MFGRVVRLAGRNGDGRRLADLPVESKPLQTACIHGLQSKYLETFLGSLYENGAADFEQVECTIEINLPTLSVLRHQCLVIDDRTAMAIPVD